MIISKFSDKKVTANQAAKQQVLLSVEAAFYDIHEKFPEATDQELDEISRFIDKHIESIFERLNYRKLRAL